MRTRTTLLFLALLLTACKNDGPGDSSSSTGEEPHCSEGWGDGPDVDPDYPPCGCDVTKCDNGGKCLYSGSLKDWSSSLCFPPCTNGPSCPNPLGACMDNDCPLLHDIKPFCISNHCEVSCVSDPCPPGYVCGDGEECEVQLE